MYRNTAGRAAGIAAATALVLGLSTPVGAQTAQAAKPAPPAVEKATPAVAQAAQPARQAMARRQGNPGGLALTDEQRTRINALREQQRAELKTTRDTLEAARKKLDEARDAATFDEQNMRAAAQTFATAQAEAMVQRARHRSQHLALLTPEQRDQLKSRREAGMRAERLMRRYQNQQMRTWRMEQRLGLGRGMGRGLERRMERGMGRGRGPGMDWPFMEQGMTGRRMPWMMGPPPDGPAGQPAPPAAPRKKI